MLIEDRRHVVSVVNQEKVEYIRNNLLTFGDAALRHTKYRFEVVHEDSNGSEDFPTITYVRMIQHNFYNNRIGSAP